MNREHREQRRISFAETLHTHAPVLMESQQVALLQKFHGNISTLNTPAPLRTICETLHCVVVPTIEFGFAVMKCTRHCLCFRSLEPCAENRRYKQLSQRTKAFSIKMLTKVPKPRSASTTECLPNTAFTHHQYLSILVTCERAQVSLKLCGLQNTSFSPSF